LAKQVGKRRLFENEEIEEMKKNEKCENKNDEEKGLTRSLEKLVEQVNSSFCQKISKSFDLKIKQIFVRKFIFLCGKINFGKHSFFFVLRIFLTVFWRKFLGKIL